MMSKKIRYVSLAVISVVAMLVGVLLASWVFDNKKPVEGIPGLGGDFTLRSAKGPVSLHDLEGKVVPLYFGFASCPDVCPTSLGILSAAIRQLTEAERQRVQPIFISVDPGRDTPEILADYTNAFYPGMLGLTGTKEEIDDITWRYKALYKLVPLENSAMGYSVDHSSIVYIIGKSGIVHSLAQHGTTVDELSEKLKAALN
ncbi:MAG: SCO family protein [Gammaproteobacteria bacterium]|nr:MAG: SCO family protein [Gammaproteobacteria bacterium]